MNKSIFLVIFVCLTASSYVLAKKPIPNTVQTAQPAVFKVENNDGSVYGSGFFLEDGRTFVTTFDLMYKFLNLKDSQGLSSIFLTQGNKKFQVKAVKKVLPLHNIVFLEIGAHSEHFLRFPDRSGLHKKEAYSIGFLEDGLDILEWTRLLEDSRHTASFIGNHTQTLKSSTGGPVLNRQGEMIGIHLSSFQLKYQSISNVLKTVHLRSLLNSSARFESDRFPLEEQFQISLRNLESLAKKDAQAQLALANRFFEINDMKNAIRWYRQAAKNNVAEAQYKLAIILYRGIGVPQNKTSALSWFRKAAKQGMVLAQYNLGIMYSNGDGVTQDKEKAIEWLLKAAERGISLAQYHLGSIFYVGEVVHQNKEKAAHWYRQAAELGHPNAQYNLAVMLFNGDGIPQDKEQAINWYRESAEQGFIQAQHNLADILKDNGNREEALIWFRRAAEQGSIESQYDLALTLLNNGKGTPQERQEALLLLTEITEKDYKDAQKHLDKLSKKHIQYLYRCRDVFRSFLGK